ncbi:LLM class flavin-dependent oxidoreductase [Paenibacillus cisolokensis]|uniref:LLM class flavin-dependent oxidoreductase n=1 Tax=Paenibacillus cisolokensis TaxID=1658519 RepID=UPI0027DAF167|nr:LLM class flavin-dependent oxidoreductase [Paenibacillus cisolokensis]
MRESEDEAWEAAWNILSKADRKLIDEREKRHANTDAVGQKRQMELFAGAKNKDYLIGPNLWSGLSAVRGGGGVTFVGTPEQVSDRIVEFVEAGITSFICPDIRILKKPKYPASCFCRWSSGNWLTKVTASHDDARTSRNGMTSAPHFYRENRQEGHIEMKIGITKNANS